MSPESISSSHDTRPRFGNNPEIEQVFSTIDGFVDAHSQFVLGPAIASQVNSLKRMLSDLQNGRVRIESILPLREAAFGVCPKFAERCLKSLYDPHPEHAANRTQYRSVAHITSSDYFRRPFIVQMANCRRLAFDAVLPKNAQGRNNAIQVEHLLIIPETLWPDPSSLQTMNIAESWDELTLAIDGLHDNGQCNVFVVAERSLRKHGCIDKYLDFGLYGDVAVATYMRWSDYHEEVSYFNNPSVEYDQCQLNWLSYKSDPSSTEWGRFKQMLNASRSTR